MYKRASRSMQHALRVDTIDPTKGFVGGVDPDYIPSAANMSEQQCREELSQLSILQARLSNELIIAKREGDITAIAQIGQQLQTVGQRRSPIKNRLCDLKSANSHQILGDVVRELCSDELARHIFQEARRRVDEAWS